LKSGIISLRKINDEIELGKANILYGLKIALAFEKPNKLNGNK
jgi:hypothetical protein